MKELLRTDDPVRLSWAQAMLAAAGIRSVILDQHISAASVGAIPRRLMVEPRDHARARRVMAEAEQLLG